MTDEGTAGPASDGAPRSTIGGWAERLLAAQDEHPIVTAIVLVALQLAIRLPGLDSESLWWDESWTAALALQPASVIVERCRADVNPPLYHLLLSPWAAVFGISAASLRGFSLAASILAGLALHRLALRQFGREAALYAFLAYATSGVFLYYAHEARSYTLTAFLCALSFLLFLRNLESPRVARSIALAIVNALGAYVHFTILLAFLAQLVAASTLYRRRRQALVHYVLSQAAAAVAFLPWVPYLIRNTPRGDSWLSSPGIDALSGVLRGLFGSPWQIAGTALVFAAGLLLAASGRLRVTADARKLGVLVLWATLPIALSFVIAQWFPIFGTRYVLTAALGAIVLQAVVLSGLPIRGSYRGTIALSLAALALASPNPVAYVKPDWRGAAATVARLRGDDALIVVSPYGQCLPLAYYLEPEILEELFVRGESTLEAIGVLCVDDDRLGTVASRNAPRDRVIVVIARGSRLQPREIVESFGSGRYAPATREDLEGVVVMSYRRS
ncbi:MAG: hypothetical protein FJ144_13585 [Deltaproteobacteria bacterium]|nr:hypothetical protein [Deltaproteobacteria bacterium]